MLSEFPAHLRERMRFVSEAHAPEQGEFVLYWMRNAVRVDENPALDAAQHWARQLRIPLLVYQALSEHYPYASDRHHTFMLEGARDVQQQCSAAGIAYAFFLATSEVRDRHLIDLASRAAVTITEDMPVDPARHFLNRLKAETDSCLVVVDTACVVPMQLVGKAYTRAFKYRQATEGLYAERLTRAWPEIDFEVPQFSGQLPFEPLDLQTADIAELVSQCDIDHSIPAVVETIGGSAQGYARWQNFKDNGLLNYAKLRNDALVDGVSRMSAYLHYGMVSPIKIARDAACLDHPGAEKYLDELLIWRELAYVFCFYRPDHDSWDALPNWARQTLVQHAHDDRDSIYSWEQLSRGRTADEFWNAAQQSLLVRGELHNNVRMTWGKSVLNWTASPERALQLVIDLNNRYALDGLSLIHI